jgi:hypothetical protein
MMKRLLTFLMLLVGLAALAADSTIGNLTPITTVPGAYRMPWENTGVVDYYITFANLTNQILSGYANQTFATTAAHDATNGFPWGVLYDAAGVGATKAHDATNGFPWLVLSASAADILHATNDLSGVLKARMDSGTNDLSTVLKSRMDSGTNDLSTVLKARMDSGTNDLSTVLKARMDAGTNDTQATLKTYADSKTNAVGIIQIITNSNPLAVGITGNAATVSSISGNTLTSSQITTGLGYTPGTNGGTQTFSGVTNTSLTASRVVLTDANSAMVSAAASGAVPINADGSATTATQVTNLLGSTSVGSSLSAPICFVNDTGSSSVFSDISTHHFPLVGTVSSVTAGDT